MKTIPLSDVTLFVRNGASIKQNKITHDGYPITRIETLSNGIFNYDKMGFASIKDDKYKDFYLKNNDVLLSHINSEKFLGRSVLYINHGEGPIIHGMNLLNIRFDQQKYTPSFFVWYTKSAKAKNFFRENTKHAVNQASIASSAIKSMPVPDVPLDYQETISNSLNQIEKTIHSKQNLLCSLDSLVKSLFVEMFPEDGDFEHDTLSSITTKITDGSHNPPKGVTFSEYIMASSQNVNDVLNLNDVRYLSKEDFDRENKRTDIQKGDVLFTIVGTIGRTYVIKSEKMVFQRSVAVIKPKKNIINPIYLKYFLSSDFATKQIDIAAHGVAQKGIYLSNLKELDIVVPKIEVQDKFASFVEQIDKSRFVCHSRYFLWLCLTLESSTMAYSSVVSIFECPRRR
jgi:type I restriction enzyme S subunit